DAARPDQTRRPGHAGRRDRDRRRAARVGVPRFVTSIDALATSEFCYLTTRGRRSGRPHRIEIWFVAYDAGVYLLSDTGRSDWCRNLIADPHVTLEVGTERQDTLARPVDRDDPANAVVRPA